MSKIFSPDKKIGFTSLNISAYSADSLENKKLVSSIKSLWNNKEGKTESSKFKIVDSSGKGFYDRVGEFIVLDKKNNVLYLCEARTNYSGSWQTKDDVVITGIKKVIKNQSNSFGGVFG